MLTVAEPAQLLLTLLLPGELQSVTDALYRTRLQAADTQPDHNHSPPFSHISQPSLLSFSCFLFISLFTSSLILLSLPPSLAIVSLGGVAAAAGRREGRRGTGGVNAPPEYEFRRSSAVAVSRDERRDKKDWR